MPTIFLYHPDILPAFPDIVGGVIYARELTNGRTPPALHAAYQAEQMAVLERTGDMPLSEIESLNAWRRAFRAFGVNPTQYRSAAEALLRRLTRKGDIPSINALVDLANLVSIRYALPVAAFNTAHLQLPVTVHHADGSEWFTPLGRKEPEHPSLGEVVFSDREKTVIARRWCWRQSDDSAARPDTTTAILTVEAQHPGAGPAVEAALDDLLALLSTYTGGTYQSIVLTADKPEFR